MKINAILIDDEPKALAILKNKIERFCSNVTVIAETQNPEEGLLLIKEKKPHIVFLDIAMPQMSGFDLLTQIPRPDFEVIFVTAFDEYAIDAINHCAIGYLLKPVDNQSLIATVIKAIENIEERTALEKNKLLIQNLGAKLFKDKKIVVPTQHGLEFLKIEDIVHLEGDSGYTKIHVLNKKTILSSHNIGYFSKLLKGQTFYLIHKSHLINMLHLEQYLNEGYVILTNNSKLPISRNKRQEFIQIIKN